MDMETADEIKVSPPAYVGSDAAAASPAAMEAGFYEKDSMVEKPCEWDNMQPCDECRKTRCTTCTDDSTCATCEIGAPRTCFAFCELDAKVCEAQKSIDVVVWQEMYAAVRCLRDRRDPKLRGLRGQDFEHHLREYYPGFCRQHNREGFNAEFVDQYWRRLQWPHKLLLNYMIDGSLCAMVHIDSFFREHRELYQNVTYYDVMQLLLTPAGLMAVDPVYIQTFMELLIQQDQFLVVSAQPELMQKVQTASLTVEEADQWIARLDLSFQKARHEYRFLVNGMLQASTVSWLMHPNECLRHMHWNLLFYKILMSLLFGFTPVQVRNALPAFHPNWKQIWTQTARAVQAQLAEDQQHIFLFHWSNFMENMENLVVMIDEIMFTVPVPDNRPEINPFHQVQSIAGCSMTK